MNVEPRELGRHYRNVRKRLMQPPKPRPPEPQLPRPPEPQLPRPPEPQLKPSVTWVMWPCVAIGVKRMRFEIEPVISVREIVRIVAGYYGVAVNDLQSQCRTRPLVDARHVAIYLAREMTPKSFPLIAAALGGRDHTTAMHGYRRMCRILATDEKLRDDIAAIKQRLA